MASDKTQFPRFIEPPWQTVERPDPMDDAFDLGLDPSSGQLVLRGRTPDPAPPADDLPATDIARRGFFADDPVRKKLENIGEDDGDDLFFDARTGQLVVRPRSNPATTAPETTVTPRDDLPATTIARRGFFINVAG